MLLRHLATKIRNFEHAHWIDITTRNAMNQLKKKPEQSLCVRPLQLHILCRVYLLSIVFYASRSVLLTGTGWLHHQNLVMTSLGHVTRCTVMCSEVGINEMRSEWISLLHPRLCE